MKTTSNTRAMRARLLSVLLTLILLIGLIPQMAFAGSGPEGTIDIIIDFEGYNLGQGFYIEPTKLTVPEGTTAGEVTVQVLNATGHPYSASGSQIARTTGKGDSFYLESVKGFGVGQPVVFPDYLNDSPDFSGAADALDWGRGDPEWLGEFDYTWMAGWMLTVNNIVIGHGAGAEILTDDAVIRWQFTVVGYGADLGLFFNNELEEYGDLGDTTMGGDLLFRQKNKDALIRALFADTATEETKTAAKAVIINPLATTEEIASALSALIAISAPTDYTDLNAKIAEAEGLTSALYTSATWETLQTALGAATELVTTGTATQDEADAALAALSSAISGLATVNAYRITAPADATVKVFRQVNNYNLAVLPQLGTVDNGDGTVTAWFAATTGNKHFRVALPGKITKAGYFTNATTFDTTVTFGADEDPGDLVSTAKTTQDDANVLLNIPAESNGIGHNILNLAGVGETYKLRSFRAAWQIVDSDVNNQMIEPDFHYNVLSGDDVISVTPDANIPNWATITALKEGTAVVEVYYDAIDIGGGTTSAAVTGRYGATTPTLKGLAVITVGADNGVGANMTIAGKAAWDSEFDIFYTLGDSDLLSVVTTGDAAITASNPGAGQAAAAAADGKVTVYPGNNVIKSVATDGAVTYKVVRVAKLTPIFTPEKPAIGEAFTVKFDGLVMGVPKMSGIYNPNFANSKLHIDGTNADVSGGQYTFSHLTVLAGTYTNKTQTLGGGYIASSHFGSGLGAHRNITDTGVGVNMSAPVLTTQLGVFPVIKLADYFEESEVVGAPGSGDLDGNGAVTAAEALLLARYVISGGALTSAQILAADMDDDGILTMADAVRILRLALA